MSRADTLRQRIADAEERIAHVADPDQMSWSRKVAVQIARDCRELDRICPLTGAQHVGSIDRAEMRRIRDSGGYDGGPSPTWDGNRWLTN